MSSSVIKIYPKKLWKALCEADVVHFAGEEAYRLAVKYYPAEEEDGHVASISLIYLDTMDDSVRLSEKEIMECEAEWDTESEDITITSLEGSKCYLPSFRLYKEFHPDLNNE